MGIEAPHSVTGGIANSPVCAVESAALLVNPVQVPQRQRQFLMLYALHCRISCACKVQDCLLDRSTYNLSSVVKVLCAAMLQASLCEHQLPQRFHNHRRLFMLISAETASAFGGMAQLVSGIRAGMFY